MSNSSSRSPLRALEGELAHLVRSLDATYRKRSYPMERAHYLLLLDLQEQARSSGELATRLGLDHSTVTRQLAAIEALGYAARRPNPDDRRSTLIEMTALGRRTCQTMQAQRLDRLDDLLSAWTEEDCSRFTEDVRRLNKALRRRENGK